MSSGRSKKVSELPQVTSVSYQDRLIVDQKVSNDFITSTISTQNLLSSLIKGPYDSDAQASAIVPVGSLYYTSTGVVKIRLV